MKQNKSIGIMGGTFDPIHYGHLIVAEHCREEYGLDQLILIPAFQPPHKIGEEVLASSHRHEMTRLAIQDNEFFRLSDIEIRRKGYSYTIDTIEYYLDFYPGTDLYFILGLDAFLLIETWKEYRRALALCNFIVVNRPGYSYHQETLQQHFVDQDLFHNIKWFEIPGIDISSSYIRKRVAGGKTIKYMLPPQVEAYILQHRLYHEGSIPVDASREGQGNHSP